MVAGEGLQPDEYALHALRIGGATHLSAGGASPAVMQREGRWVSDAYTWCVRSHGNNKQRVSRVIADAGSQSQKQPRQGTKWGD